MSYYNERMLKVLAALAGDWLGRHGWPRTLMGVSFVAAALVALLCSVVLVQLGVSWTGVRFGLSTLGGYLAFVTLISVWIRRTPVLNIRSLLEESLGPMETREPSERDPWVSVSIPDQHINCLLNAVPAETMVMVTLLTFIAVAVLGILFVFAWYVANARWYLGSMLVAAGKVQHRAVPSRTEQALLVAPIQQTIWPAVGLCLHYTVLGWSAQVLSPQMDKILEVFR